MHDVLHISLIFVDFKLNLASIMQELGGGSTVIVEIFSGFNFGPSFPDFSRIFNFRRDLILSFWPVQYNFLCI